MRCGHCGEPIVFDDWCWTHEQTAYANCTVPRADGRPYTDGDVVALLLTSGLPLRPTYAAPSDPATEEAADA